MGPVIRPTPALAIALVFALIFTSACQKRSDRARETGSAAATASATESPRTADADPATDMVTIPAGDFVLGCDPKRDPACKQDEQPALQTHLAAFEIDRTEVTQAAYQRCIDANRCALPSGSFTPDQTPRHAVTEVTWSEARAYCAWRGAHLPTEAEWEKAARGGDGRIFPWGDLPPTCEHADTARCGRPRSPVGSFPSGKSPYGVLDMAGGVDEWVADEYVPNRASPTPAGDGQRVARGGAYDPWHIRSTARSALAPGHHSHDLGFRCAR